MRDIYSNLGVVQSIAPAVLSATTNGADIDLLGFNSAMIVISTGAIVGSAVMVPKLQESDDGTTYTDVAAADLIGSFPASLSASSILKIGNKGTKRHVRPVLTLSSGTSIAASVNAVKGSATKRPVA